jgi:cytochrome oxidase Cu insertion factor (SCO1/SenC/PrrC family)
MRRYHRKHPAAVIVPILILLFISVLPAFGGEPAPVAGSGGSVWGADYFPNIPLVTQDGKKLRFFDDVIKGKVVALNFIYTNCPDMCALETARLREVQRILGDRVGRDVFIYSITIDPERDTPEVLKRYAEKFQVGPGWLFLTGKEADITLLRRKLGVYSEENRTEKLQEHDLSSVIGNQATGQWMKVSPYENPYVLATQLGSWLHNWKMASEVKRNYADAPQVRNISKGEEMFRTRCSSCHTIGVEEGAKAGPRPIGPDLLGVTWKRDRAWLTRWMKEPNKMLAEKEPLAMALLAEYNNIAMPNLGLTVVDIQDLFAYIEEESRRVARKHHGDEHHDHHH